MGYMNEAGWDRVGRIVVGLALLALGWTGAVGGGFGTALQIVGFVPLVTGLVGWCPLYAIFRFRTKSAVREATAVR